METCCQPERVLRHRPYRARYDTATPDVGLVDALRAVSRPLTALVVYGHWCHDSVRILPDFLKALAAADNANLSLLAVHVPYHETDPSPFMAGPIPVTRYPTITFLDGRYETTDEIPHGTDLATFVEERPDGERLSAAVV